MPICMILKTPLAKIVDATAESIKSKAGKDVLGNNFRDLLIDRA